MDRLNGKIKFCMLIAGFPRWTRLRFNTGSEGWLFPPRMNWEFITIYLDGGGHRIICQFLFFFANITSFHFFTIEIDQPNGWPIRGFILVFLEPNPNYFCWFMGRNRIGNINEEKNSYYYYREKRGKTKGRQEGKQVRLDCFNCFRHSKGFSFYWCIHTVGEKKGGRSKLTRAGQLSVYKFIILLRTYSTNEYQNVKFTLLPIYLFSFPSWNPWSICWTCISNATTSSSRTLPVYCASLCSAYRWQQWPV